MIFHYRKTTIYGTTFLSFPRRKPLKSFDTDGTRTVLCSFFRKDIIAPGMRACWIARVRYRDKVTTKIFTLSSSMFRSTQLAIAKFYRLGGYHKTHYVEMRQRYGAKSTFLNCD